MIELDAKVTVNNFQVAVESFVHRHGMGYLEAIMYIVNNIISRLKLLPL